MKLADKILEVEQDYKQFKLVTLGNYLQIGRAHV